jgi:conjugative transfer region lipoprotein (TIGR03751 family)
MMSKNKFHIGGLMLMTMMVSSCATKPPPPSSDTPNVKEAYIAAMNGQTDHVVHQGSRNSNPDEQPIEYKKPKKLVIPNLGGAMQNPELLKRQSDFDAGFPMLPNPQVMLYIYPHFQKGLPVMGNWTTFTMFESNHYALPSEVATGHNLKTY